MRLPPGMKLRLGKRNGDHIEATVTIDPAVYCPCAGECHRSPSPCSFGCLLHRADATREALRIAVGALDVYLADDGNDTIPPDVAGRALAAVRELVDLGEKP